MLLLKKIPVIDSTSQGFLVNIVLKRKRGKRNVQIILWTIIFFIIKLCLFFQKVTLLFSNHILIVTIIIRITYSYHLGSFNKRCKSGLKNFYVCLTKGMIVFCLHRHYWEQNFKSFHFFNSTLNALKRNIISMSSLLMKSTKSENTKSFVGLFSKISIPHFILHISISEKKCISIFQNV